MSKAKARKNIKIEKIKLDWQGTRQIDYFGEAWDVAPSYEESLKFRATWDGEGYYDKENETYVYTSEE